MGYEVGAVLPVGLLTSNEHKGVGDGAGVGGREFGAEEVAF